MENNFLNSILDLHQQSDWKEILKLNKNSENSNALKILWVWPSASNLKFIENALIDYNILGVVSLGCGCGLFEWILEKSTGFPVIGYEINEEWWRSKYSNPPFIQLKYVENEQIVELKQTFALFFCYFNDGPAFREYVKNYSGEMIIIIGPQEGTGRHTDPQPFCADFGESKWRLVRHQEVKDTKDFIAVYIRCKNFEI